MASEENKTGLKKGTKVILGILFVILIIGGYYGLKFYQVFFAPNATGKEKFLYVRTGYDINDLNHEFRLKDLLKDLGTFNQAAAKMGLASSLKPGRYRLSKGMNNRSIINMLKAGNQDPVMLKFQNIRKKENFAAFLSRNLEPDSLTFFNLLDSAALIEKYGFNKDNSYVMFIPNTYEMYWNISAPAFFGRMHSEYDKFWNAERKQKAAA